MVIIKARGVGGRSTLKTYCAESAAKVKISTEPVMQKTLFQEKRDVSGWGATTLKKIVRC